MKKHQNIQSNDPPHWIYDDCMGEFYWCSNCNATSDTQLAECPKCHSAMEKCDPKEKENW